MQVLDRLGRLEAANAVVAAVVHDAPDLVHAKMLGGLALPWPLLVDTERSAYRAWGCRRASLVRSFLSPAVNLALVRLLLRGERLRGVGRDVFQLGGDFVIAPGGLVAFAHRMGGSIDRAPVERLVAEVERVAG